MRVIPLQSNFHRQLMAQQIEMKLSVAYLVGHSSDATISWLSGLRMVHESHASSYPSAKLSSYGA